MTRLWLIRHGPTHARNFVGWSDLPADLSDQAAIRRLAHALPDAAPIVSSDLTRAIDTANAVADAMPAAGPRLPHDRRLREMNFGRWELRHYSAIEAEDRQRARAFWEQPGDVRPPGGESWNQAARRVSAAIDRLLAEPVEDIIVVAHFGVILTQVQRALGIAAEDAFAHRIDPLSLTRLDHDGRWEVRFINHRP